MKTTKQNHLIFLLFFALIAGYAYSNTLDASWHLDDIPNIVNNMYLHIDHISVESLLKTLYTNPRTPYQLGEKMYRPVACLSFALNWYAGKDNVTGYHLVNIAIHFLTSFFLFFFILNLFHSPALTQTPIQKEYRSGIRFKEPYSKIFLTAFLSTLFWVAHPIHTQAVTYIVQRMALLVAMFYILGMLFYLKGRLNNSSKPWVWYACCVGCFILSLNSKENGIMLPVSLLLVEVIFFQDLSDKKTVKNILIAALITGVLLFVLSIILFFNQNMLSIFTYEYRTFSLIERLLSQPRVLVFHLSQIFFPLPERFSIAHDFILSPSLFRPWTTIPSILFIFTVISFAIYKAKQHPLLSFAIIFFFVNHIIESSVIPLEIIFEHRNYLPSMFLFLPIGFWISQLLSKYHFQKKRFKYSLVIFLVITTAISFSISSRIRNEVWKDEISLWTDACKKAPGDARPWDILATELAWGNKSNHPNRYDKSIELYEKALTMNMPSVNTKAKILGNIAAVYSNNQQDYQKAIHFFKKALTINPDSLKIRLDMAKTFIVMGNYDQALENIELLISKNDQNAIYHNLKGFVLLWQGKYEQAFPNFQKALRLLPSKNNILLNSLLLNMGVNLSLKGNHEFSAEVLEGLIKMDPKNLSVHFALIENSLRAENKTKAIKYVFQMLVIFDSDTVLKNINVLTDYRAIAPISKKIIGPFIVDGIANHLESKLK